MSPPLKKKRVCLPIPDKLRLIDESESGVSSTVLSKKYGVAIRTVQKILHDKESERQRCKGFLQKFSAPRKYVYNPRFNDIDSAVFLWFTQQRSMGNPVIGDNIREIALVFNEKLQGTQDFLATSGWLNRFKQRHKISAVTMQGENFSKNHHSTEKFTEEFKTMIEGVHPSNLYNADEAGLFWRAFPLRTLVGPEEVVASGLERNKDRVTFLFCANATGTHALPLLMIGKSQVPRCWRGMKDVTKLPVIFTHQSNAWMTAMIFLDWYGTLFIEEVKQRQQLDGIKGKVVLLLDRAGCHPPKDCLDDVDSGFSVEYLPSLCTSVLQPMDLGPIETMKRGYRRALLRKLLGEGQDKSVTAFQQTLTLNDCAHLAAQAWGEVHPFTLARVWWKLLGEEHAERETASPPSPEPSIFEQLKKVTPTILEAEVEEWLLVDDGEPGHVIMNVEQIVDSVRGVDVDEYVDDDVTVNSDIDSSEKVDMDVVEVIVDQPPATTLQDVIAGLTTAISWLQHKSDTRCMEYRRQLETMVNHFEKL